MERFIDKLNNIVKQRKYVFSFYTITICFVYWFCRNAGFVTDYIDFEQNYEKCGFIHYSDCAGLKNFRYLQHAFSYTLFKTVGSGHWLWWFLYSSMHALAGYLGFCVLVKLFNKFEIKNAHLIAFISAGLFLISPYQTETLVWRVCIQYIVVQICLFAIILLFLNEEIKQSFLYPCFAWLLFLIALFSIEQAVIIPVIIIAMFIFLKIGNKASIKYSTLFYFTIPAFISIAGFFLLSKIVNGQWITHYGSSAFNHFISIETGAKFYAYFFKHIFLLRQFDFDTQQKIYHYLELPFVFFILTCFLLLFCFYALYRYKKGNNNYGILLLLLLLYFMAQAPVIQLYFSTLLYVEGDRLGYISSFFIFAFIAVLLFNNRFYFLKIILLGIILANIFYLAKMINYWRRSEQMMHQYLENYNFNFKPTDSVFILGVPDNYKGIYSMRTFDNYSGLQMALKYRAKRNTSEYMKEVVQFNQNSFEDGLKVKKENDSTLYVDFSQYGSWFWRNAIGAQDTSTPNYDFKLEKWGYHITFRSRTKNQHIIYPDSLKWKEFVF